MKFREKPLMLTLIAFIILFLLPLICGCMQVPENDSTVLDNISEKGIVFNDTYGNRVELSQPAERIVVTYYAPVEMLIAIGAADHVVGVDHSTITNKAITEKLRPDIKDVGSYQIINVEAFAQIAQENLVIIFGNSRFIRNIGGIQALNPEAIVYFDCMYFEQLNNEAYALGEMTGHREGAQRYIGFNKKYKELVESRLANISDDELLTVYTTFGKGNSSADYVDGLNSNADIFKILHVQDTNRELNLTDPVVSPEWIFQKDPDIVVSFTGRGESIGYAHSNFINRANYKNLTAVHSNRVFFINRNLLLNPRSVIGLVYLAKAIYPDRFADIDPDAVRREYAQEFGFGGEEDVEWFYPPFEPVNATAAASTTVGVTKGG
jgi:iron complex transport system substrate-binding protein